MKSISRSSTLLLSLVWLLILPVLSHAQAVVATLEKTFSGINRIEIEGDYCDVEVSGSATSEVRFKGEIRSADHYYLNIHTSENGGLLKIWVDHPKSNPGRTAGDLILTVPNRAAVEITNANGSLVLENMSGNAYNLTSTLGKITARNISANLTIQSTSGSVQVSGIKGDVKSTNRMGEQTFTDLTGQLTAEAENGRIMAKSVTGKVLLNTTRGQQEISNVNGPVVVEAKEGKVVLNAITGNTKATTESGSIELNQVTGTLQLVSVTGSQSGKSVRLTGDSSFEASSGSINMQLTNAKEKLSFYLTATSGHLKAKGSIGRRNLVIDNGGIKITGKTASGSQTYF